MHEMIEVALEAASEAGWRTTYSMVVKKQAWGFEQGLQLQHKAKLIQLVHIAQSVAESSRSLRHLERVPRMFLRR